MIQEAYDRYRQTGRTTAQMKDAPLGAWFVWPNDRLHYPRCLARDLGRDDLRIIGPSQLHWSHLAGSTEPMVVDHAVFLGDLTDAQFDTLREYQIYRNRRETSQ